MQKAIFVRTNNQNDTPLELNALLFEGYKIVSMMHAGGTPLYCPTWLVILEKKD